MWCQFSVTFDVCKDGPTRLIQLAKAKLHQSRFKIEMGKVTQPDIQKALKKVVGVEDIVHSIHLWMKLVVNEHQCFNIVDSPVLQ